MRRGANPMKDAALLSDTLLHRVIIPVHIPELAGYYAQSLKILELCLESLRLTAGGRAAVTIVSNGCADEAARMLECVFRQGWVDQLVLGAANRGKVDALVSAARGTHEPLLTFADCDVLFRRGWLEAIEALFNGFPECGIASPVPLPALTWHCTSSTVLAGALRGELGFAAVVPPEDLDRFAHSIDNPTFFQPHHRRRQMVVRRGGAEACVGCGHFVCTLRRQVLDGMPKHASRLALQPEAERSWIDLPPDRLGYWRLATTRAYAWHMGNEPEPWMEEEIDRARREAPGPGSPSAGVAAPRRHWTSWLGARPRRACVRLLRRFAPLSAYP